MTTYKFTNGIELTQAQVMQQYNLQDEEDLEIWADDHYNPSTDSYDL